MNIEAVAADIDLTILPPSPYEDRRDVPPTQRVLEARARLDAADIPLIAVTSRNAELMAGPVIQQLGLRHPSVLDGGATIYDMAARRPIERRLLAADRLKEITGAIGRFCSELYCDPQGLVRTAGNLAINQITEAVPSLFAVFGREDEEAVESELQAIGGLAYAFNRMDGSELVRCVQVTQQGATKEDGLRHVLAMLGISPENVMGIADGPGDAGFLSIVGRPVVMGDADLPLLTLPRRQIVPAVRNDGFAIGVERHVFGEEGPLRLERPPKWRDGHRPHMREATRDMILEQLAAGTCLVDAQKFNQLADNFSLARPVDPWQTAVAFTECFGGAQELLTCDLDLLRPCLGVEHASGVSGIFEEHLAPFIYHDPDSLLLMRLHVPLQDVGKGLSKAVTGDNFSQGTYNVLVTNNATEALAGADRAKFKIALRLLESQDFIGQLLQAKEEDYEQVLHDIQTGPLAKLREAWPEGFEVPLEDFLVMAAMSDMGAHTRHAAQMNAYTGELGRAVTPEDAQLTELFEQPFGGPLYWRPDLRARVLALLPGVRYTRPLLDTSEQDSLLSFDAEFKGTIKYLFIRNADAAEIDPEGGYFMEVPVSDRLDPPADMNWVRKITVYADDKNVIPPKPPQIAKPYVLMEGSSHGTEFRAYFYTRGGRIWHKTDIVDRPSDNPMLDRMWRMNRMYDIGELVRHEGVRALAAADAHVNYGRPLSEEEADEFCNWFGTCD